MRLSSYLLLPLLSLASCSVFAAGFSTLEERMSAAEFQAAGLNQLSPQQLQALNDWLRAHSEVAPSSSFNPGSAAPPDDRNGFRFSESNRNAVTSTIVGDFTGWHAGSTIKLANGQEWKITDDSELNVPKMSNPAVSIEPKLLGSWLMKVEGYNKSARVTRVK